jgi:hypothetical protein
MVLESKVLSSNLVSVIHPLFQLNISRVVGPHILKNVVSAHTLVKGPEFKSCLSHSPHISIKYSTC